MLSFKLQDSARLYQVYCIFFLNIQKCKTICEMPKKTFPFPPHKIAVLELMAGCCLFLWKIVWDVFLRVALSLSLPGHWSKNYPKVVFTFCVFDITSNAFIVFGNICDPGETTYDFFTFTTHFLPLLSGKRWWFLKSHSGEDGGLFVRRIYLISHERQ